MPQDVYIYNPDIPVPEDVQHIEIPEGVAVIKENAFRNCHSLQSVNIPDSVTIIGGCAFDGCYVLQSVTIPDSVTGLGPYAFRHCGLRSVTLPDGITEISKGVFYGCSDLQSVTIPDSVTEIGDYAFDGCSGLQSVTIPDGVTKIGDWAFSACLSLQLITIPESVTKISDYTFSSCRSLKSVTIPNGVTEIGEGALEYCSGLRSITIPDSVTEIGRRTFWGCSALQSVTIPDGIKEIEGGAFRECSNLRTILIPDGVTVIGSCAFDGCSALQSVMIPDNVTTIRNRAFSNCPGLQSLIYQGINLVPFINIDGHGVETFDIIKELIEHQIPLSENAVRIGIDMAHYGRSSRWIDDYPVFGTMRFPETAMVVNKTEKEHLQQCFTAQKRTRGHVPGILDKLAVTVCACGIPPERLAETFDIEYTKDLLGKKIPIVPATACRCYYNRGTCDMLIQKNKISVMAEAIGLYNRSEHRECYRHLMDFILSHPDTKIEDLRYAVDHAEEIPMRAGTTLTQVRQHRTYIENLAEVAKIEMQYERAVPKFRLSDYSCSIDPVSITYDGMTARVLDLSDDKDIALAARLGELTNCCQCLGSAGETAMMHGFLNPDAGFWVIEDKDGKVRAQAEIWETNNGNLVFDNIEFADTDKEHLTNRAEQLRGVIAAWAMESGYRNIIMGCGYNELGVGLMEQAPIPELPLTPEEVFALQRTNSMWASFRNVDAARQYMQTDKYNPGDFVYTDANERCVYIKKDGIVSDYLMEGYDRTLAEDRCAQEHKTAGDRSGGILCL